MNQDFSKAAQGPPRKEGRNASSLKPSADLELKPLGLIARFFANRTAHAEL